MIHSTWVEESLTLDLMWMGCWESMCYQLSFSIQTASLIQEGRVVTWWWLMNSWYHPSSSVDQSLTNQLHLQTCFLMISLLEKDIFHWDSCSNYADQSGTLFSIIYTPAFNGIAFTEVNPIWMGLGFFPHDRRIFFRTLVWRLSGKGKTLETLHTV